MLAKLWINQSCRVGNGERNGAVSIHVHQPAVSTDTRHARSRRTIPYRLAESSQPLRLDIVTTTQHTTLVFSALVCSSRDRAWACRCALYTLIRHCRTATALADSQLELPAPSSGREHEASRRTATPRTCPATTSTAATVATRTAETSSRLADMAAVEDTAPTRTAARTRTVPTTLSQCVSQSLLLLVRVALTDR